jgi:Zn-dependent M28 family amino/carboxypeptidase
MDASPALGRTPRQRRVTLPILLAGLALLLVLGGLASAAAPTDLPETIDFDQTIAATVSQVATSTLEYELAGLTGERPVTVAGSLYTITTRHTFQTEAISMATRYAYEQFAELGLAVTYHNYAWYYDPMRNVVAEKPGLVNPDEIYLITAHLDSRAEDWPHDPAPGADDNGSGSVAVLMAARLLAPYRFAHTVRFVLFTGEEQGFLGSAAYAAACAARGEDIRGVVNLDMIAYNSDADRVIDLYDHTDVPTSLDLTRLFSDVVGVYGLNLVPNRFTDVYPIGASDQWSFIEQGYPAFLAIEDMDDSTPEYHTPTDRLSTLDLDYYADFTRAAIATIAHLGRPLSVTVYLPHVVYAYGR